ncbi:MAG TPA: SUMF1/EgtB/PvdO family nonheme iron enzyme, partial [Pyrinomonadaceae bacterium]|nr:SUMF1/EgtB/PvdO family nonheme iron enzyme [Pyrinomonadaceae bacterium]
GATFEMGIASGDIPGVMQKFGVRRAELFQEETPKHKVTIGSFYLDRTEVTNEQFKKFLDKNSAWQKDKIAANYHNGKYLQNWSNGNFPAGQEKYPVTFISWYAATSYCQAQGKRLPTEAEWEYATRGGLVGKEFPWGDDMPDKTRANYSATGIGAPTAVAMYPANGYGLHDMAGNVWEFLADEWNKYSTASVSATTDFLKVTTRRALRGGSFGGAPVNLRITYRDSHSPENAVEHVGFRCAMTSPVQSEDVNELLRGHYVARAAHFNHDAKLIYADFADDFVSIDAGQVKMPDRDAGMKRMQAYFDASTFLEWDDITPPIIRISDDATMAYVVNHKKVRLLAKDKNGKMQEEVEVFAWVSMYRKVGGRWKLTAVASTRTPEADK